MAETLRVELTSDWKRKHLANAVPGSYWDAEAKVHVVDDPDARTAAVILTLFPELDRTYSQLQPLREQLYEDARPFDNATAQDRHIDTVAKTVERQLYQAGQRFYDFQDLDLGYLHAILRHHKGAYIGWERGLGKTLGAASLIEATGAQRTLVVCPNTAKESVWVAELRRFLPNHWVLILPNAKAKREQMLHELVNDVPHVGAPIVLVVHYEALGVIAGTETYETPGGRRKKRILKGWDKLGTWDLFVADEAHRLSNVGTIQHRAACKVPCTARIALSGSILQNHPEELFGVLHWLFPDTYKRKWADWCDRYIDYVKDDYGQRAIGFKADRLDEMRKELGIFMVYRRKSDELDLPKRTEQTMMLDLAPKQRKAYDELLGQFWTVLEDRTLLKAENALSQLTLLRRTATGLSSNAAELTDSTKLDWTVEEIVDHEDEAFVVFSWYKAPLAALRDRLQAKGVACHTVTGDTKQADRTDAIAGFQGGAGRVFLGTISTLGESVNLHRASNAIFLDRAWNPAANAQAADRIYRIGQTRPVTITHLVSRDTVDELRVQPTLASKEAMRRAVFGGV